MYINYKYLKKLFFFTAPQQKNPRVFGNMGADLSDDVSIYLWL